MPPVGDIAKNGGKDDEYRKRRTPESEMSLYDSHGLSPVRVNSRLLVFIRGSFLFGCHWSIPPENSPDYREPSRTGR